ncbi:MAG TPA: PQQ-dependent sugar dehydrogenase [Herpetosiphonaceae bacterium]|nr:PQQ-dependent sugar dehydrogenase [Herpetosiphonaceae bacterium]
MYRKRTRWSLLAWLPLLHLSLVLVVLLMTVQRDRTRDPLCFHETGQCVSGRFRAYWEANGGVAVFGLPITPARPEFNPDANTTLLTQWFERMRFELHPELSPPFDVLLGRLGDDRLWQLGVNWRMLPASTPSTAHYARETGHAIAEVFWPTWSSRGVELGEPRVSEAESRLLFGDPLGPAQLETNADGYTVLTQWFERARFEYHPTQPPPNRVLLGRLGAEVYAASETSSAARSNALLQSEPASVKLELVGDDFDQPVFVTHAGDGTGRLFVVEKAGAIRLVPTGELFLDLRDRVGSAGAEQGLLGLAFHPRFREVGLFFVNYTDRRGNTVVARFGLTADGRGDPKSEQVILYQPQPEGTHNGGMLSFGPDGLLYIGVGDGGGADDPLQNAQNPDTLFGTLLRIDIDAGVPYAVPPDNPFVVSGAGKPEVWAIGLRNPWRFSFDRQTGDLYIADVGQSRYDWVHFEPHGSRGGTNYGWPIVEGLRCLHQVACERAGLALPVAVYDHRQGCAVVGGYVYRGQRLAHLQGTYVFGDFCSGRIWELARNGSGTWSVVDLLDSTALISSFGEDEAGEIYVADFGTGRVYRIAY